jgi:two-component system, NtrC family, response regulator AtoC
MTATILIVDDEENARSNIRLFLSQRGYEVLEAATLAEAREVIRRGAADLILLDVQLGDGYGPTLLEETAHLPNRPLIILITAHGDVDMAVDAMKNGARDFIQKPIRLAQLEKSIERASEIIHLKRELAHLREERSAGMDFVIGKSEAMLRTVETTRRAAAAQVSVLITGRTGTGKEILAKLLHQSGPRVQKPFIALNCAAVQSTMVESELFGHEAGAFTSAEKRKAGLMETADGGILFLDEISSMSLEMQAKLLRALEERSFRRVGGTNLIKVDVQVVAASNRDLKAMMEDGTFREDLYYRLKVVDLHLPSLSERREDIPELVGLFIRKNNMSMGVNVSDVTPKAMEALMNYSWPGNIRELRNVMERAMLFCDGPSIDLPDLPSELHHLG